MDPHPTPFPGKRRPMASAASVTAASTTTAKPKPKPKSIATARAKLSKKSPTNATGVSAAAAQPKPRRAFGTVRSTNVLAEKPPPLQKLSKPSPPKLSRPSPQKPVKPSRGVAKPLKKDPSGPEAKAKKKSQRVSFQGEAVAGSGEKSKATSEDAAAHTPVGSVKTVEPVAASAAATAVDTPYFSAQNCSNCRLDHLESATYWLAQIRLAESAGKHSVAAAFFRLAFECQAQPLHRIQSELRNYAVRHENAGASSSLFDELLQAHSMPVNQPKFDSDGFEKVDAPLAEVEDKLGCGRLHEECLECDGGDDLVDVGADSSILGATIVEQGKADLNEQSFERKLEESFEFDDDEAPSEPEKNVSVELGQFEMISCSGAMISSECKSSDKMQNLKSPAVRSSSSKQLSSSPADKKFPSVRGFSSKWLSSGSPSDKKSPVVRSSSSKRLSSGSSSDKKSPSVRGSSSKRFSSGSPSDGKPIIVAGVGNQSKGKREGKCESPVSADQLKLEELGEDTANNESC